MGLMGIVCSGMDPTQQL